MSHAESEQVIEHVNKLLTHADELKKAINELYEKTKSSEIVANLERLVEIRDALAYFVVRKANEFSVILTDTCASDNCEDIDVLIKRPGFHSFFRVKRNASLIEIYQMFFDSKKALEKLITDLVTAIISVTRAVEKETDLLDKIKMMRRDIDYIDAELQEIKEKLEDP
jgi:transcription termination factor NusB